MVPLCKDERGALACRAKLSDLPCRWAWPSLSCAVWTTWGQRAGSGDVSDTSSCPCGSWELSVWLQNLPSSKVGLSAPTAPAKPSLVHLTVLTVTWPPGL